MEMYEFRKLAYSEDGLGPMITEGWQAESFAKDADREGKLPGNKRILHVIYEDRNRWGRTESLTFAEFQEMGRPKRFGRRILDSETKNLESF